MTFLRFGLKINKTPVRLTRLPSGHWRSGDRVMFTPPAPPSFRYTMPIPTVNSFRDILIAQLAPMLNKPRSTYYHNIKGMEALSVIVEFLMYVRP